MVDALGRRVVPGLNDSHHHVVRGGLHFVLELRWDGVPTLRQGPAMVREQAARTGRQPGLDVQPLGRPVPAVYGRNVAGVPLRSDRTAWTGPKPSPRTPPAVPGTGEQDVKGILSPGYYADFAVLSDDFFEIPEERIPEIEALLTVVGGRVVHDCRLLRRPGAAHATRPAGLESGRALRRLSGGPRARSFRAAPGRPRESGTRPPNPPNTSVGDSGRAGPPTVTGHSTPSNPASAEHLHP
ncbi:amidohydrolase family protein [Streptomyces canus]